VTLAVLSYAIGSTDSMPLTQLVGAAALSLLGAADSTRVARDTRDTRDTSTALARTAAVAATAAPTAVDSLVVDKSDRRLTLYYRGSPVRTYLVALGTQPVGDKVRRGDGRTPEGLFRIEARNPRSRYHLALRISYPDAAHAARARALGVSPGGDIMIHGLPKRQAWVGAAHRDFDWTEGCIAVTNAEIEEIWQAVPVGTPIHIKP
ncbi:MAG TPA: L,D-transpeptidase family protein, partial [Gemmatimonadaceae bacterium]|nr:L,D-transpeptidase family protein [Gemmatimonadaceae bacterium]